MMISKLQLGQSEEDTLSLCDLPLPFSPHDEPRSAADEDYNDDLFEFWTSDSSMISHDIIFCGKLFPETTPVPEITSDSDQPKKNYGVNRSWTRLPSLSRVRSVSKPCLTKRDGYKKLPSNSSTSSSRWQWLMFGSMRLPGKMELEEMRNRQSRQNPKVLFGLHDDDNDDGDHVVIRKKTGTNKGRMGAGYGDEHRHQHHRGIAVVKVISCIGSI
ncbi:hypothetical protein Droror1_Dr00017329 [Drosera rotundifolia]